MINDFFRTLDAVISPMHKKLRKGKSCQDILTPRDETIQLLLPNKGSSNHSRNYNIQPFIERNNSQSSIFNNPSLRYFASSPVLPLIKKNIDILPPLNNLDFEVMREKRKRLVNFAEKIKLNKYICNKILKKNTPVKEERDSSSDIKKVLIDDRVELFKTHLEVPDSKRESQQIIFKHKRLPKITKGIVHLEDLASEDKIIYHAKLVEKVGSVYYEFNTKVWNEEAEINNSNEMKANKISELIKAYRKKEVNNINKGKLDIQTKLKMNEDEMKSKKIYNNLLHLLRQK